MVGMREAIKLALVLIAVTAVVRFVLPRVPVVGPQLGGLV